MAWRVEATCAPVLLVAWVAWATPLALADQGPARPDTVRPAADASTAPGLARVAASAPLTALSALSCLAALLSCACAIMLWRRVESGQEAAKASMYAAGKLFDNAARRFTRSQDEAGSAVEAAASAAGQAGQACARLANAVREAEARLSACLGEGEARLHAAAEFVSRYENAVSGVPALLSEAMDRVSANATPAIEDATAALRSCAEAVSARLGRDVQSLPGLMAEALAAAEARGTEALQAAANRLHGGADRIVETVPASLSEAGAALGQAAAALGEAQARHAALITRVEALAGVLPSIATSLASTAAAQRQLLSQGRAGAESGLQEMRHAASCLSASVDEAATLLRRVGQAPAPPRPSAAPPSMHPALRPDDFGRPGRGVLHSNEDIVQPG